MNARFGPKAAQRTGWSSNLGRLWRGPCSARTSTSSWTDAMTLGKLTRRTFLCQTAVIAATGELALHHRLSLAAAAGGGHPLAPKPGHFAPKAKHLILFFFTGGLSHVDTFDY